MKHRFEIAVDGIIYGVVQVEESFEVGSKQFCAEIVEGQPGLMVVAVVAGCVEIETDLADRLGPGRHFEISIAKCRLQSKMWDACDHSIDAGLPQGGCPIYTGGVPALGF